MKDAYEKCTEGVQLKIMRFKSVCSGDMNEVAKETGVCKSTLNRIIGADDPRWINIKKDTRQAIERRYEEVFGGDNVAVSVRLSKDVCFSSLIKIMNEKGTTKERISNDTGIGSSTVWNYAKGSQPRYEVGVQLIEYAAKKLAKSELEQAGVICD